MIFSHDIRTHDKGSTWDFFQNSITLPDRLVGRTQVARLPEPCISLLGLMCFLRQIPRAARQEIIIHDELRTTNEMGFGHQSQSDCFCRSPIAFTVSYNSHSFFSCLPRIGLILLMALARITCRGARMSNEQEERHGTAKAWSAVLRLKVAPIMESFIEVVLRSYLGTQDLSVPSVVRRVSKTELPSIQRLCLAVSEAAVPLFLCFFPFSVSFRFLHFAIRHLVYLSPSLFHVAPRHSFLSRTSACPLLILLCPIPRLHDASLERTGTERPSTLHAGHALFRPPLVAGALADPLIYPRRRTMHVCHRIWAIAFLTWKKRDNLMLQTCENRHSGGD